MKWHSHYLYANSIASLVKGYHEAKEVNFIMNWKELSEKVTSFHPPQKRKPDFLVIGAQKAATTWLWSQFKKNSSFSMLPNKEIHYFDRSLPNSLLPSIYPSERFLDELWRKKVRHDLETTEDEQTINWMLYYHFSTWDDEWYQRLFGHAPNHTLTGEVTPRYAICDDEAIEHMYCIAPNTKLIFCIRNPVDRFWSQCLMKYDNNSLTKGEPSAMAFLDTNNGKPRGLYSEILLRYCKKFDPSQILLVFYDAIVSAPQKTMEEIHAFLGVPQHYDYENLEIKINKSSTSLLMPTPLRNRVLSAYRSEIKALSNVLGGYTSTWLENETSPNSTSHFPSTLQLTAKHAADLKKSSHIHHVRKEKNLKVFCLSMQRSGTTSVGDWLESHGLIRSGSPTSSRLGWSRSWMNGKMKNIFEDEIFKNSEVLEDDPFWFPAIYIELAQRFPEARFILLEREPNAWFDSMCRHSAGQNPGLSDIHALVYNREEDLSSLIEEKHLSADLPNLLSITNMREHYIQIYKQHIKNVQDYFLDMPGRLFYGKLTDESSFIDMLSFLNLERDPSVAIPLSNKLSLGADIQSPSKTKKIELG